MIVSIGNYQQISTDVVSIRDAIIEDCVYERRHIIITISYYVMQNRRPSKHNISLIVSPSTVIKHQNGNFVHVRQLKAGMKLHALVSSTMTQSVPPQTKAYVITLLEQDKPSLSICTGRILFCDWGKHEVIVGVLQRKSRQVKFSLDRRSVIMSRDGKRMNQQQLKQGMIVRIEYTEIKENLVDRRYLVSLIQVIS